MHRDVLSITDKRLQVDHKNKNGLDNRRANLRVCTGRLNQGNKRMLCTNTSGFKGVHLNYKKWTAMITKGPLRCFLGSFATREEAARAYDKAAREYFGEFAALNFPEGQ